MAAQTKSRSNVGEKNPLVAKLAEKYSIDESELLHILKSTAFRQSDDVHITNEQMYALLVVSDQYNLNPFTKEIYAFPGKGGGIIPVVGVDGWNRIANEHPQFDGVEFVYSDDILKCDGARAYCHAWIEAVLYRKDRANPIRVREYLDECYRPPFVEHQTGYESIGPWQTHPKRFLRHKALIQCYRVGFSFVGIYDEDEAYRILDAESESAAKDSSSYTVVPFKKVEPDAINPGLEHQSSQTLNEIFEIDFNQEEVDKVLVKLVDRAEKTNQWQAAEDYAADRWKGNAAVYAKREIAKAKAKVDESSQPGSPETLVNQEETSGGTGQQATSDGTQPTFI